MRKVVCIKVPNLKSYNRPLVEYGLTYNVTEDGTQYSDGAWRVHFNSCSFLYDKKYFCSLEEWREQKLNNILDV